MDNALRHGAGRVLVQATRDGRSVELQVSDEGAGFPPAFLHAAFERFARADESRTEGGTGLGLSIVRSIARAHGGEAYAANAPGGGALVRLSIPDAAGEATAPRAAARSRRSAGEVKLPDV
jgi:signal transduction histidine kinase